MFTWWTRLPRKPPENAFTASASALPTAWRTCSASSARPCSITLGRHVGAARQVLGPEVGPELRVVHEHVDVSQRRGRVGQLRDQPLVGEVEAVVVGDLHHPAGAVAGRDDGVDVLERDRERLFDQHVQPGGERREHGRGVGRVRRGDDDGVEPGQADRLLGRRDPHRDPEPVAHPLAHRPAGIGDHGQVEPVAQERQVRQVHGLADQPRADHRHPLAVVRRHGGNTRGLRGWAHAEGLARSAEKLCGDDPRAPTRHSRPRRRSRGERRCDLGRAAGAVRVLHHARSPWRPCSERPSPPIWRWWTSRPSGRSSSSRRAPWPRF